MTHRSLAARSIANLPEDILLKIFTILHRPFPTINRRALPECADAFSLALTCDNLLQIARRLYSIELQCLDTLRPIQSARLNSVVPHLVIGIPAIYTEDVSLAMCERINRSLSLLPSVSGPRLVSAHLPGNLRGPSLVAVLERLAFSCPNLEELYFSDGGTLQSNVRTYFRWFDTIRHLQICSPSSSTIELLSNYMPSLYHLRLVDLEFDVLPALLDTLISRTEYSDQSTHFSPITHLDLGIEYHGTLEHKEVPAWTAFARGVENQREKWKAIHTITRVAFGPHLYCIRRDSIFPIIVIPAVTVLRENATLSKTSMSFSYPFMNILVLHYEINLNQSLEWIRIRLANARVVRLNSSSHTFNINDARYYSDLKTLFRDHCSARVLWIEPDNGCRNSLRAAQLLRFATLVLPLAPTIVSLEISAEVVAGSVDIRMPLVNFLLTCQNIETIVVKTPLVNRVWGVHKSTRFLKNISLMANRFSSCCPELDCFYMEPMDVLANKSRVYRDRKRAMDSLTEVERRMPLLDIETIRYRFSINMQ